METNTTIISTSINGDNISITKQVEESMSQSELINKKNNLTYQQIAIKNQVSALIKQHEDIKTEINHIDLLLQEFETPIQNIE